MTYVRFPLSLRNVEDLLNERGADVSSESVRFFWQRFGPKFTSKIRKRRTEYMRSHSNWKWHPIDVFVKINGERHYLWRAVDHEGEVLESYVTKTRYKRAALKFFKKSMRRLGCLEIIVADKLQSYSAVLKETENSDRLGTGRWVDN